MTRLIEGIDFGLHGRKYILLKDCACMHTTVRPCEDSIKHQYFTVSTNGTIRAKKGYVWDGASGGIDTKDFMRGSLFHDVICQSIEEKLLDKSYRKAADELLWQILIEDGMPKWRAWYVYNAIRLYVRIKY
jgi:hypothetical protein